jgi:cytochrome c oxidase subunit 3/cytochrome o ubiquinol oxidase subunit 3
MNNSNTIAIGDRMGSVAASIADPSRSSASEVVAERSLTASQWGLLAFLVSEVALFSTLVVAYVTFLGKDVVGPTPAVLSVPLALAMTCCLVASSATVHIAARRFTQGVNTAFTQWWISTVVLGALFLAGTAYEWHGLITRHHLTISRNLFGTTYYTLIGFHGLHLAIGLLMMLLVLALMFARELTKECHMAVELISWYWHFVDAVWVVLFVLVYFVGR